MTKMTSREGLNNLIYHAAGGDEPTRCLGEGHTQLPPHDCPFRSEIYDDDTTLCTCCKACQHECAMDT